MVVGWDEERFRWLIDMDVDLKEVEFAPEHVRPYHDPAKLHYQENRIRIKLLECHFCHTF